MKAHIPLSARQRALINNDIKIYAQQAIQQERQALMRRYMKLTVFVLHNSFGFGAGRSMKFINELLELTAKADDDEIFFEHVDIDIIDRLGLEFERDYTR